MFYGDYIPARPRPGFEQSQHVASCGQNYDVWRCIHDGESRVVFSLEIVVCALVSANFAAARAAWVEFFHCKGGGRAAKRVIFNVISGLVFWPLLQV